MPETKISKVISAEKWGDPYAPDPKYRMLKTQQVHEVTFEDGTQGKMSAHIDVASPVEVGKTYAYHTVITDKGSVKIILDAMPASSPSLNTKEMGKPLPDPATPPSMAKPAAPFDQHERTQKPVTIPDNQPRTGVVKLMRLTDKWVNPDEATLAAEEGREPNPMYKWIITFEDGAIGTHWQKDDGTDEPFTKGQVLNYTYDKVYGDGSKRIALAPTGSSVDKETSIMRMSCLKTAVELLAIPGVTREGTTIDFLLASVQGVAKQLEKHVLRTEQ